MIGGLPGTVCVAGLTEITNSATAAGAVLPIFTTIFGAAPTTRSVIKSYSSALLGKEYVAIAVNGATVLAVGRITAGYHSTQICEETAVAVPPPPLLRPPWQENLPETSIADYRGIVYVKVRIPVAGAVGPTIAVGFVHNTYTLNTNDVFMQTLPAAVAAMAANGVAVSHVYLGGDFNVKPRRRSTGDRQHEIWPYSARVAGPAFFHGTVPSGTTFRGSLYDYWFADIDPNLRTPLVDNGVPAPVPTAYANTMDYDGSSGVHDGWMSDHAAIALRIT
ncbi:hypothetical protein [Saccharothrix coeruleofusca]|uniref:Endonuclease/exonuclease/phosphatase domain-containing protein n=1 Tax=Saccharothrix coeruleofusca TaxID=33919 RepID=A0A918EEM2_9PSEU|nr:hypothetical protein [Saccharothrix coeruleofusca]MBP2339257.1 hypothetical protein [Saccharothrix coeruleofusca]GGP59069.1 hypothetical protein GCM10010185_34440 [Saccharothrix coeruleofusca]